MSEEKAHFVSLGEFDPSRLVLEDPVERKSKNREFSWFTSKGGYLNDDGEVCRLYLELPEQFFFGINGIYPNGTKDTEKSIEIIEGLQICYLLTSMETIENPTKDEQYAMDTLKALWQLTVKRIGEFVEDEDIELPGVTESAYHASKAKDDPSVVVKPCFDYPMKKVEGKKGKEKLEPDTSKPQRSYLKLETFGKGRKMKCNSLVYGPGDKAISPLRFLDRRGRVKPVIHWSGVYYGAHGKRSWGASVTLRVSEMNFVPQKRGGPPRRMLAKNTAPAELLDNEMSDEESDFPSPSVKNEEEDHGFSDGDSETPDKALEETKKQKKKRPQVRKKPAPRRRFRKKEKEESGSESDQ